MSVNGCDIVKTIRIIGGCCGVLVCVLGVLNVINTVNWPSSFIYGVYQFLFGLLIIVGELHIRWIMKWFAFLGSFIGFGAFYIFVGLLSGVSEWYYVLILVVCLITGTMYCILGCCMGKSGKGGQQTQQQATTTKV